MFNRTKTLKQEKIVERWSTLIGGAQGEGEQVITGTIRKIEEVEPPHIFVSRKERKPGLGFIKERREFLIAEHKFLDGYDMYIGVRDYGKQLFVSWYLVEEPVGFWRRFKRNPVRAVLTLPFLILSRIFSVARGESGDLVSLLNLFDNEELTAYVTTVHHALLDSVKEMMEGQKLDFTKIDQRTRGFLNIV